MSDNKNQQDGRERSRVSREENYELSYLEEKLSVSRERVREAIDKVGNSREAIEKYLTENI